jgi:hypothetical protein
LKNIGKMKNKIEYLDELIETYHLNHPDSETPLNYIEVLGVERLIEIMEDADGKPFEIELDYSIPLQPQFKKVQYKEIV